MKSCVETHSEAEMRTVGSKLAKELKLNDVVLFSGELGAGKTTMIRGVLESLGWKGKVRSPTFTLMQIYPLRPEVLHVDLYRLESEEDFGLDEESRGRIALIEWPERFESLTSRRDVWRVKIEILGDCHRVTIQKPKVL